MDLSTLPKAAQIALLGQGAPRWRPGLAGQRVLHSEIFAPADEAGGAACALSLALDGMRALGMEEQARLAEKPLLWVQDALSIRRTGRPYRPGLPPALRHRVIHVATRDAADALFALEEGMRCRDLACVIGEIAGNPRALDLTASRRLGLAAERHGVPLFLVRHDAARDISSARMRWQVRSTHSPPPRWNPVAPRAGAGTGSWHVELFRSRAHAPGEWILHDDGRTLIAERPIASPQAAPAQIATIAPDHGDLAGAAGDRSLAAG